MTDRAEDWISGGMSWMASLMATLLKPQLKQSPIVTAIAVASSGRDEGEGGTAASRSTAVYRSRQCAQMPAISTSGLRGEKPAAREDAFSASAAVPPGASPTAPQRSQIRKMTRSPAP
jgi:hypothetical protein